MVLKIYNSNVVVCNKKIEILKARVNKTLRIFSIAHCTWYLTMNGVIKNKTPNETLPIILEDQILVLYKFFPLTINLTAMPQKILLQMHTKEETDRDRKLRRQEH